MNISQPNFSALTNQAEVHVSAAAFHFDFSLFKLQSRKPPEEYRDIGRSLSARRKNEADEGQSHLTAVQLGVLFGGIVPKVPHLIRAYGLRCSELANSPEFNPKGSSKHGLFANEVGVDGTSVWAAATSGEGAIAVLLLACMLSRMWDPPAAISIWMQLIAERKQVLASSGNPLEQLASNNVSLTREQIAAWHTSTHAWRLTADEANARRQNQLLLIINNLGIAVNTKLHVYESVISAWQTAMITVDQLVSGKPQSVQTGAPLLGLAAWHLYPDMVVFCHGNHGKPIDVRQNDALIETGGIMTLGLRDTRRSGDGIYWSLPLAHLRYYGQPVQSEAILSSRTSRTSIDDLVFVALGSLIRRWCASADDIELALTVMVQLYTNINVPGDLNREGSWMSLLASAARKYLNSNVSFQEEKLQLIRCGQRRYPLFLDDPKSHSIFGLSSPRILLGLLPGNAARVDLLRHVARDFSDDRKLMIIQCKSAWYEAEWELVSVERMQSGYKRKFDPVHDAINEKKEERYIRWLATTLPETAVDANDVHFETDKILLGNIPWIWGRHGYTWTYSPRELYSTILGQEGYNNDWKEAKGVSIRSLLAFGDPNLAALYCLEVTYWKHSPNEDPGRPAIRNSYRPLPNIFVARHISWTLEKRLINSEALFHHLQSAKFSTDMLKSLKALSSVANLYGDLTNATIDLRAAEKPLYTHSWIPSVDRGHEDYPFGGYPLTREEMFACIAKFESGGFNLHSSAMSRVLAISSGNSIYVARCLLQDPCGPRSSNAIERVVGNLGKNGMAFLICPDIPDVRPPSDAPHLVPHHPFDGGEEDCFNQTSILLSFTGWELAIDVGSRGNRDIEASYVEAAIQLYDHGNWVADLNILNIFTHHFSRIMPPCIKPGHNETHFCREELSRFVSIDSWEELLDSPIEVGVIRARGNWQARLAAAALSIQRGHETRIIPDQVCWPCYLELEKLPRRNAKVDDSGIYCDDDVFAAVPQFLESDDSESETEEMVQAVIRKDEKRRSQVGEQEDAKESDPGVDQSNLNIVYVL